MFKSFDLSIKYAKLSYSILFQNPQLFLFPVFSGIGFVVVLATFWLPLGGIDFFETGGFDSMSEQKMYFWTFLLYFACYFVITFFGCALTACTLELLDKGSTRLSTGLNMATSRLPQIFMWAALSGVVGVMLTALERNSKIGSIVSAILGSAWSALSFFVIPYIVVDRAGPIEGISKSSSVLSKHWGTALVGNFSLGVINFLIVLPITLIIVVLFFSVGQSSGGMTLLGILILGALLIGFTTATGSAANEVFKAILFRHATNRSLPENIDPSSLDLAFSSKK